MMKKRLRLIIIFAAAAIVILAGYLIAKPFLAVEDTEETQEYDADGDLLGAGGRPFVYEPLEPDDIESVEIASENGTLTVYKDDVTDEFQIRGAEKYLLDGEKISALVTACRYMLAIEKIESPEDDAYYGLSGDASKKVVKVTSKAGKTYTVYVGDMLVTNGAYYCKLDGKEKIYAIGSTIEDAFHGAEYYVDPLLAMPISESECYIVENFKMYKNGEPFVAIERQYDPTTEELATGTSLHSMTYPARYLPSETNYSDLLLKFANFSADEVVKINCTEEDLAAYGLDKPSAKIEYEYKGNREEIIFGKSTEDGESVYCYSEKCGAICSMKRSNAEFLDWGLIDFVSKSLFSVNIDKIERLSVFDGSKTESFVLSGSGKDLTVTRENGGIVDTHNFRQFYRVLLLMNLSDYSEPPENAEKLASLTLELADEENMTFDFYDLTTRRCYYTINGKGEFYIGRNYVDKMISDLQKLISGEEIDADVSY